MMPQPCATALRYSAFIDGGPKAGIFNHAAREITPFDLLDRTRNLVAYAGGKPVGTMRIVLPDARQSAREGTRFNLPMEQSLHFREVPEGARIAEVGRLAIHVDHRGSDVIRLLYKSVHRIMSEHDIRYYAGSSLTGASRIEEAISYYRTLLSHGFASKDIIAEPRSCSDTDDQHEPIFRASSR
ncbi:hypothetical protein GCM10011390_20700 [Aureimonas endophytica]|uniref:N-acyl amino acid synthase FeeM catalytic core domain-containing protein n=1 Tax=Aureimonas endophytica TaxID=2027858 RepID=A0A916ZK15_9HYPH|nr:GNAT family N-acyltransferase [Aureimonas endophytica]GGE01662.1 hypothetical protein GCM10011390_20700 [Aureimonas endophytica]